VVKTAECHLPYEITVLSTCHPTQVNAPIEAPAYIISPDFSPVYA